MADTEPQPCPDPSAHEDPNKTSEHASIAALKVTRSDTNGSSKDGPLDQDGKMSSRSAAQSLKYAQPKDLPSFPSRGTTANTASAAAMLSKDARAREMWKPENVSAAGSKAAILAHKDGGKLDLWQHSPSDAGNKAASLAMRNQRAPQELDRGYTDAGRTNSMLAATKSHHAGRQRAGSTPTSRGSNLRQQQHPAYPDSHNSAKNALNAASVSHRASTKSAPDGWDSEANQAARLQNAEHLNPQMFTEHPIIGPERDEQRREAALHASAVSMAKRMYEAEQRRAATPTSSDRDVGSAGAATAHRRNESANSQPDIKEEAMRYIYLQDAAHKLAQERLAKVDKDMEASRYREYYGYGNTSPKKSRLSIRSGGRRKRSSSEGQYFDDSDDEEQARRIRSQMTQLNTAQSSVSDKQRQEDRARLLAAAEKRVHARMHDMDEKVFLETGKVPQSMMDEWEAKARERAEKERESRDRTTANQTTGRTHIGGGKYMDQSEIEAIARQRLQPTLEELDDTAAKKRARDEEIKREMDKRETERMEEKMRDQETKAEFKRIKEQDKAAAKREKEERKAAQRQEKEEAKIRKSEDKRKSREQKREEVAAVAGGAALAEVADNVKDDTEQDKPAEPQREVQEEQPEDEEKDRRGIFGRIASRLRKQRDEEKPAEEEKTKEAPVAAAAATTADAEDAPNKEEEKAEEKADEKQHDEGAAVGLIGAGLVVAGGAEAEHVADEKHEESKEEKPAEREVHDEGSAAPATAATAAGVAAAGGENDDVHPVRSGDDAELYNYDDPSDEEDPAPDRSAKVAAAVATLGLGATVAGVSFARRSRQEKDEPTEQQSEQPREAQETVPEGEVSSLSTGDDIEFAEHDYAADTAPQEHDGSYNFAAATPAYEKRPDLERHISTIQDSSGDEADEEDSDDLDGDSSDDEEALAGEEVPVETQEGFIMSTTSKPEPSRQREQSEAVAPDQDATKPEEAAVEESKSTTKEEAEAISAAKEQSPLLTSLPQGEQTLVATLPRDEHGNIVIVKRDASPSSPHLVIGQPVGDRSPTGTQGSDVGAPAPAVKTGPRSSDEKPAEDKEKRGVRGFFSKLKGGNKSKQEEKEKHNKLHKHQTPAARATSGDTSAAKSEKGSFQGGAKLTKPSSTNGAATSTEQEKDDIITPVTTTSAGRAEQAEREGRSLDQPQPQQQHIGTDGPIGDPKHVSGIGGNPRPVSPSSFQRNKARSNTSSSTDLEDVSSSSSGVDEEDVKRGRAGRLAEKLGLSSGKGRKSTEEQGGGSGDGGAAASSKLEQTKTGESNNPSEDQFEEARDHFDESLAPPPAFGGQAKSESPVRGTRFQEQL